MVAHRFKSIGMEELFNTTDLFTTLVPPAIFIAVLAAQVRFFKPGLRSKSNLIDLLPKSWKMLVKGENYESKREIGGAKMEDQSLKKSESESSVSEFPAAVGEEAQGGQMDGIAKMDEKDSNSVGELLIKLAMTFLQYIIFFVH